MSQEQNGNNSSDIYMLMGAFVFIASYFYISSNYSYLAFVWKWMKVFELSFFYLIPDWIPIYGKLEISSLWHKLIDYDYDLIHKDTISDINDILSGWITWPLALYVCFKGFKRSMSSGKIDVVYNHDTLLEEMAEVYPNLKPYVEARIEYQPTRYDRTVKETYQYGASIDPVDFALMNPPLNLEAEAKKNPNFKNAIWDGDESFDTDLAERAFKAQMGNRYQGMKSLNDVELKCYNIMVSRMSANMPEAVPKVRRYLYSILKVKNVPKVNIAKLDEPNQDIYRLCEAYASEAIEKAKKNKKPLDKKTFLSKRNLLKILRSNEFVNPVKHSEAQILMAQHAFVRCGIMSVYERARSVGVIDTGPFAWIKEFDRTLWFCISSFGRKVSYTESGGPFAHRLVELAIGEPLHNPEVIEAITGLEKELKMEERNK